jgi:hypothetical protein
MRYELLVDGHRETRVDDEEAARAWIREYRFEHIDSDRDAVHVQVRRLSRLSWLTGGTLVPREQFLD